METDTRSGSAAVDIPSKPGAVIAANRMSLRQVEFAVDEAPESESVDVEEVEKEKEMEKGNEKEEEEKEKEEEEKKKKKDQEGKEDKKTEAKEEENKKGSKEAGGVSLSSSEDMTLDTSEDVPVVPGLSGVAATRGGSSSASASSSGSSSLGARAGDSFPLPSRSRHGSVSSSGGLEMDFPVDGVSGDITFNPLANRFGISQDGDKEWLNGEYRTSSIFFSQVQHLGPLTTVPSVVFQMWSPIHTFKSLRQTILWRKMP